MKNNGTYGTIDDLTINYDGNRLLSVTDDAESLNYAGALDFHDGANMTAEYAYDANGALTRDSNRGISSIVYDYSHNPHMVYCSSGSRLNDYSSDGRKLSCLHSISSSGSIYYNNVVSDTYIDGLVLRNDIPQTWQFDGGYITLDANGAATSWNYYVTDHLGSTRKVVTSTNAVKETTNYYPYGSEMTMTSPSLNVNSNWQPFRFSGKELDKLNGLNMYDFGARWFDVAGIPAWTSVDPLAEDNCPVTPYSYCNGDPVNRIDPDGEDWYRTGYGNLFWNPEVKSQTDLQEGYYYVGTSFYDKEQNVLYREDGTILYTDEAAAIERMLLANGRTKRKKEDAGKEQCAFILSNGNVLVMPDNWNDSETSYYTKAGYSRKNHILTDSKGNTYSYEAHIHTHPVYADKGVSEYSDDALFAKADKDITMFIVHADKNIYEAYYSSKRGGLDTNFKSFPRNTVQKGRRVLLKKALYNKKR